MLHRSLVLVVLLFAVSASAQEVPAGNNTLSAHMGYQQGFSGDFGNPSGFKLFFDFAHRFSKLIWLDLSANQVFGFGPGRGTCWDAFGRPYVCGGHYYGGWSTELLAGIQIKIPTGIPLVVDVPIQAGAAFLYNRECGDNGAAAPIVRVGGGVKYFVTPKIGVGGGVGVSFGPAFHGDSACGPSYADFYGTVDFRVGAEFAL